MDKLMTAEEVLDVTSLKSRVSLWKKSRDEKDTFPKPYRLGNRHTRWKRSEIEAWVDELETV